VPDDTNIDDTNTDDTSGSNTSGRGVAVKIGTLTLGENLIDPDPNPQRITYTQDFSIRVHDCIPKPKTQCTQPEGLWRLVIEFTTTRKETSDKIVEMNAGPHWVVTDRMSLPCYIERKRGVQEPGNKDVMRWVFELIECYDGTGAESYGITPGYPTETQPLPTDNTSSGNQ